MEYTIEKLAKFVVATEFKDLPVEVVHESKRVLLDSIGCALAGLATTKGKIAVKLARRLGGGRESTIIGVGKKASSFGAAFANGELINAMDYDAILFPVVHVPPYVIPAPLALAETKATSGKELILAIALAHEVAWRIGAGMMPRRPANQTETPPLLGHGSGIFGAVAGAGKVLKLDQKRMAEALSIAGFNAPVPTMIKFASSLSGGLIKYGSPGWLSLAGVTAVILAEMEYTGDKTILDGDLGFWRLLGSNRWEPEVTTAKLGEEWHVKMGYKLYPSCGRQDGALDCFCKIIEKNKLMPDDIEEVRVFLDPACCQRPLWNNKNVTTETQSQFSVPYTIAAAAYRIDKNADWHSLKTINNPKIQQFVQKVKLEPYPGLDKMVIDDPSMSRVEVVSKGKTLVEECTYARGRYLPEAARATDEDLIEKFTLNAKHILPGPTIKKAFNNILQLDIIDNISELMKVISI